MSEPQQVKITLHADAVVAPALQAIQESIEVVGFCLFAIETGDLSKQPEFESSRFLMTFKGPEIAAEDRKNNYTNWILSKGFQNLARGLRVMLERAYFYTSMLEFSKREPLRVQKWGEIEERIQTFRKEASDAKFPELMGAVSKGLTAPLHFEKEFLSLQKVRNCLEHRGGVVAKKDVDEAGVLRLALPRPKIYYEEDGNEVEIGKGSFVKAGTVVKIKSVIEERAFKLGARVIFKPEEFHDIGWGCWAITSDLGAKLPQLKEKASNSPTS